MSGNCANIASNSRAGKPAAAREVQVIPPGPVAGSSVEGPFMLRRALIFLVVAGGGGVRVRRARRRRRLGSKVLFFVFLVVFVMSVVIGRTRQSAL